MEQELNVHVLIQQIEILLQEGLKAALSAKDLKSLELLRVSLLGKRGKLSAILQGLKHICASDRPQVGKVVNEAKKHFLETLESQVQKLKKQALDRQYQQEKIDVTLPSKSSALGRLHPVTQTTDRILSVLKRLGFDVVYGPEVETELLNFEFVNIPKNHPARDMQDTFFLSPGVLLRTHTSPVQMRVMLQKPWPVRILCPGTVYRKDAVDLTHSPMFHQIEALWVDQGVSMAHLKGVLEFFAKEIFGKETKIRFRPSFFPFVEPGAEVDVSCLFCRKKKKNTSCRVCKDTGWIEILGAGMVHEALFKRTGYLKKDSNRDAKNVSGFAFGLGVERVAMLLHEISDLRLFFHSDMRFLKQF